MPTHRSRTGAPPTLPQRKPGTKQARTAKTAKSRAVKAGAKAGTTKKIVHARATRGKASALSTRAQTRLELDPVVLEAAYRAFERLPRPRYLH